jgi:hypothetical protein
MFLWMLWVACAMGRLSVTALHACGVALLQHVSLQLLCSFCWLWVCERVQYVRSFSLLSVYIRSVFVLDCAIPLLLGAPWLLVDCFQGHGQVHSTGIAFSGFTACGGSITAVAAVGRRCGVWCCVLCPWARPSLSCTIVCP